MRRAQPRPTTLPTGPLAALPAGELVHWSPYARGAVARQPRPVSTDSGFWDAYITVYPLLHLVFPDLAEQVLEGWVNSVRESPEGRHNGQEPADRLLCATRALAAAITALVAERAERAKLERAMEKIIVDAATIYT
jgi:putative alpha-1,2-mannosidase